MDSTMIAYGLIAGGAGLYVWPYISKGVDKLLSLPHQKTTPDAASPGSRSDAVFHVDQLIKFHQARGDEKGEAAAREAGARLFSLPDKTEE